MYKFNFKSTYEKWVGCGWVGGWVGDCAHLSSGIGSLLVPDWYPCHSPVTNMSCMPSPRSVSTNSIESAPRSLSEAF